MPPPDISRCKPSLEVHGGNFHRPPSMLRFTSFQSQFCLEGVTHEIFLKPILGETLGTRLQSVIDGVAAQRNSPVSGSTEVAIPRRARISYRTALPRTNGSMLFFITLYFSYCALIPSFFPIDA